MINSGKFNGTPGSEAKRKVTGFLEQQGVGKGTINYRLRDWLISRQRLGTWSCPRAG
jgi:leucyl-tRNA synthetase